MSIKIYEISAQIRDVQQRIEEYAEEHDGLIPDDMDMLLDALTGSLENRLLNLARWVKEMQAESDAVKEQARKLSERARITADRADCIKTYIASRVPIGEPLKDSDTVISWRKSTQCVITNEAMITDDWFKVTRTPRIADIKKAIQSGDVIDGAELVEKQNLQIK